MRTVRELSDMGLGKNCMKACEFTKILVHITPAVSKKSVLENFSCRIKQTVSPEMNGMENCDGPVGAV